MFNRVSLQPSFGWPCLAKMVGGTPLFRLDLRARGRDITVYAKAEMFNFSGSIKDRMALMILKRATEAGKLGPGQRIAEATSGNAGIALAAIGGTLGHPVTIFMPDWMSKERQALLESFGAELRLVSKEEGGFLGSIARAEALGQEEEAFLPRQFFNMDNCLAHFQGTAPELLAQLQGDGADLGAFVAGVGTGGTVSGVGRYLREIGLSIGVHPIEPAESPTLSTGHKVGSHRIQGISDEFIPDIINLEDLDEVIAVHDGDAILMAQRLCRELGVGVGISSGANLIGAIKTALQREDGKSIATVFPDGNNRYLSTGLTGIEPRKACFVSTTIEFVGAKVIPYHEP